MTDSWKDIDWDAPRPGLQETVDAARRLRFRHRPVIGPACQELLVHLRRAYVNGGALLATFDVEDDATSAWFAARNRFGELGFFDAFLSSSSLRDALPELFSGGASSEPPRPDFSEHFAGPYLLDGWLAGVLTAGGAYEQFPGTPREARAITSAAADEVVEGRYDDFVIYTTWGTWSPWFFDVAWDSTHLAIDMRKKQLTLLALTDPD